MTPIRLLLNSDFTGANAFFALAAHRGLFAGAGLDVRFTPGRGAYTAAGRLADEGFDAAFGDINALIELAALRPDDALPVAVLLAHQNAPTCITVSRAGSLHQSADLAGRLLVGHASDVALRTFPTYARAAGLDPLAVRVQTSEARMADLLLDLLAGRSDGVFGYLTTHTAALAGDGLAVADCVRFLPYRAVSDTLYGSALMVAPHFLATSPDAVRALVQTTCAGLQAARAAPEAAIDAVLARSPSADRRVERQRWEGTLYGDMGAPLTPDAPWEGLGHASGMRLAASIAAQAAASGWTRPPAAERIFTPEFLPRE